MKKIAIIGANGKAGSALVTEALNQGYEVTAIVRNESYQNDKTQIIRKNLFALTKDDLVKFDVVITAFAAWSDDTRGGHTTGLMHLSDLLSNTDTRLLVVGGAGSLYTDETHAIRLMDTPEFPAEYKPTASAMAAGLDALRKRSDVKWSYLSPAAEFEPDLPRTGKYILGGEEFKLNSKGESIISYADYAIAMIDEVKNANFIQKRFSVLGE
ncbi:NAD(P)-dependent oxidoreductase [Campylobacter sp. faydin G-105]|uniref:NAD(P)-dependent oxidoreductase n=1 Tax=Campylobacter anatolicus TaxID=2829105 RepID=UPI001B93A5BC|nr:NAD(P)-dependent oxidoreductase [Campylobacter anatolicus]MBR8461932.1 NAD(P)-dependent oxidoreductase [Campylobacter anatolicus]